jgi:hypothetical protein
MKSAGLSKCDNHYRGIIFTQVFGFISTMISFSEQMLLKLSEYEIFQLHVTMCLVFELLFAIVFPQNFV